MDELVKSLTTGFIDSKIISLEQYQPQLVLNDLNQNIKISEYIRKELNECVRFKFSVAFIAKSGISVLKQTLKELEEITSGKILTSTYLMFNTPEIFRELLKFKNLEVRIVENSDFHAKGYLFEKKDVSTMIIGSANLTQSALNKNNEWNVLLTSRNEGKLINETMQLFDTLWNESTPLTSKWISQYEKVWINQPVYSNRSIKQFHEIITPNKMQKEALQALKLTRIKSRKALVISATGTGKTLLSAFDVKNFNPNRFLFIVHREEILDNAIKAYKKIITTGDFGKYTGKIKELNNKYTFASIQTISKQENLNQFKKDTFDYIVIDEAHRTGAESYQRVIKYFNPMFLLGMTATPERTDNIDIYEFYEYNVAYEIRLQHALENDMLCPFHYFGISDFSIEGQAISDDSRFNDLVLDQRVNYILTQSDFYGCSKGRLHALVFCRSIEEAETLASTFCEKGRKALAVTSKNMEQRNDAIKKLETGEIEFLISVDLLNEGIDIPCVNQIIMLRPTKSSIIFVQQLGRGLRKYKDKEYLVVIDFIGNYKNNYMIPIALFGERSFDKDILKKSIIESNIIIYGESTISFDKITKERIFRSISDTKFTGKQFLRSEYLKLKQKIGHVPKMIEFVLFDYVNPLLFNNTFGSYYQFLQESEDSVSKQSNEVNKAFQYISKEILKGLRLHEIEILEYLIREKSLIDSDSRIDGAAYRSAIRVLDGSHFATKKKNGYYLIEYMDNEIKLTQIMNSIIANNESYEQLLDCFQFAYKNHINFYEKVYKDTSLVLYEKYTRAEVGKLLNWEKDVNGQNVGGYYLDNFSNTFAIYINYHKLDDIADTIKYEDRFIDSTFLEAISKSGQTLKTPTINKLVYDKNVKKHLFVRKDTRTDDRFFYLGEVNFYKEPEEGVMIAEGKNKRIVKFFYRLETPVRHDIFDYLTNVIDSDFE